MSFVAEPFEEEVGTSEKVDPAPFRDILSRARIGLVAPLIVPKGQALTHTVEYPVLDENRKPVKDEQGNVQMRSVVEPTGKFSEVEQTIQAFRDVAAAEFPGKFSIRASVHPIDGDNDHMRVRLRFRPPRKPRSSSNGVEAENVQPRPQPQPA